LSTSGIKAAPIANMRPIDIEKIHNKRNREINSRGSFTVNVSPIKYKARIKSITTRTLIENSRKPAVSTDEIG
jgi:hypothetical protein